ncbi:MAG: aldehyde dehydrogenase family protein, partial [Novosphingobium sp.]
DMGITIPGVANAIFFNGGQVCIAGSRLYVHRSVHDQVVEGVAAYANSLKIGHGLLPDTQMGPVVSARHAERVEGFLQRAKGEGATMLTGGERSGEEVFGPVLVVQSFDDEEEVVAAANASDYGLAASVWTESLSTAHRMTADIRAGTVWINCHAMYDASLAIGGVKQSGWGRDSGRQAMDNYLEWKTVCACV